MKRPTASIKELSFLILYPPDGYSNVIEVSDEAVGDFLYVRLEQGDNLTYEFFNEIPFSMTAKEMTEIEKFARDNLYRTSNP